MRIHKAKTSYFQRDKCNIHKMPPIVPYVMSNISCKFSLIREYRNIEGLLWKKYFSCWWRHPWRHQHEKYFSLYNFGWSLHIWCKTEAVFHIFDFQNGHHFEVARNFITGSDTESWICQTDSHEYLWHVELLIDALAQILTELWQLKMLAYFFLASDLRLWPTYLSR